MPWIHTVDDLEDLPCVGNILGIRIHTSSGITQGETPHSNGITPRRYGGFGVSKALNELTTAGVLNLRVHYYPCPSVDEAVVSLRVTRKTRFFAILNRLEGEVGGTETEEVGTAAAKHVCGSGSPHRIHPSAPPPKRGRLRTSACAESPTRERRTSLALWSE